MTSIKLTLLVLLCIGLLAGCVSIDEDKEKASNEPEISITLEVDKDRFEVLPLGSVVTLNNGTKKVMITGRLQRNVADQVVYEYSACLYPEGVIDPKELYLFNKSDIATVHYLGFIDDDEEAQCELILEKYEELGLGK